LQSNKEGRGHVTFEVEQRSFFERYALYSSKNGFAQVGHAITLQERGGERAHAWFG
jgi:hypothetical protein